MSESLTTVQDYAEKVRRLLDDATFMMGQLDGDTDPVTSASNTVIVASASAFAQIANGYIGLASLESVAKQEQQLQVLTEAYESLVKRHENAAQTVVPYTQTRTRSDYSDTPGDGTPRTMSHDFEPLAGTRVKLRISPDGSFALLYDVDTNVEVMRLKSGVNGVKSPEALVKAMAQKHNIEIVSRTVLKDDRSKAA